MLLKPCSIQPLWLFQLTMPHLSAAGRKIPTWILKISMHSFKSHPFNQVLKITVHLNCLLPLPIPAGGGRNHSPKTEQNFPSPHRSAHTLLTREHLSLRLACRPNVKCLCQLGFSQVQGTAGAAQGGTKPWWTLCHAGLPADLALLSLTHTHFGI